jgi:hypothetical protein
MEQRFCTIVQDLCKTIQEFIIYIDSPMRKSARYIQTKSSRNRSMDGYTNQLDELTHTIDTLYVKLIQINSSLNTVFLRGDDRSVELFFEALRNLFLVTTSSDLLTKLHVIQKNITVHKQHEININLMVTQVRSSLLRILSLSIELTTRFVPQLQFLNELPTILGIYLDRNEAKGIATDLLDDVHIRNIMIYLGQISTKTYGVENGLSISEVKTCLNDKDSTEVLSALQLIQLDMACLNATLNDVKFEIKEYKDKSVNIFTRILEICTS